MVPLKLESEILRCFRAGILAVDLSGTVVYVNEIAGKILNVFAVQEGENLRARSGENAFFRMLVEALELRYLPSRLELDLPGRDGSHRFIGFTLSELRDGSTRTGICAFFKDLTHVEMAEENRDLNDRLRLLGQMAAGLAHEIRNPIASIGVHCGLLRSRHQADPRIQSSVTLMEQEIGKVEYIIRECLNFVRPAELGIRQIRVSELLSRISGHAAKLHPGVEVRLSCEAVADIEVELDEGLMEQALSNIVTNAAQACEGGGNVSISSRIAHGYWDIEPASREPVFPPAAGERDDFLLISIRDDGVGIPEEIRDKIFVPFFTTKKGGTGIGLPLAQKIIYAHKGVLDIVSETGKGTEFLIKVPVKQSHV
jgi:signal transduction histidine kinase